MGQLTAFALQMQVQVLRVMACFPSEDDPGLFADNVIPEGVVDYKPK